MNWQNNYFFLFIYCRNATFRHIYPRTVFEFSFGLYIKLSMMTGSSINSSRRERILSVDIFRGWTILFMILVNNPGNRSYVFAPLEHAAWNGWTPADLIFPFFLWISGFSTVLSFENKNITDKNHLFISILRRSLILIMFGLFLSVFPFGLLKLHSLNPETFRIPGVLQRIGICYFIAASVYLWGKEKLSMVTAVVFLLAYASVIQFFPVPGYGPGLLTAEGNAGRFFDSMIFGKHTWSGSLVSGFDPEGALSSLGAVATMQFGILCYGLLKISGSKLNLMGFFISGIIFIISGYIFNSIWPINKNLWSVSYVFFTCGMAICFYAILHYTYDIKKIRFLSFIPGVFGKNSILAFLATGIAGRFLNFASIIQSDGKIISLREHLFDHYILNYISDPYLGSLAFAIMFIMAFLPLFGLLNFKNIYLKI